MPEFFQCWKYQVWTKNESIVQGVPGLSTKVQAVLEEPEPCLEAIKALILQGESLRGGVVGARRKTKGGAGGAYAVRSTKEKNTPAAPHASERGAKRTLGVEST